MQVIVKTNSF